jgi:hypothetical protein
MELRMKKFISILMHVKTSFHFTLIIDIACCCYVCPSPDSHSHYHRRDYRMEINTKFHHEISSVIRSREISPAMYWHWSVGGKSNPINSNWKITKKWDFRLRWRILFFFISQKVNFMTKILRWHRRENMLSHWDLHIFLCFFLCSFRKEALEC